MDTKDLDKLPAKNGEIKKGESRIIVELIEYEHDAVVRKSILKKDTGSANAIPVDAGQGLNETTSPFDTYVQIIDGSAIIDMGSKSHTLRRGSGIMIPADQPSNIRPNGRFKLILTVIKSGYEE